MILSIDKNSLRSYLCQQLDLFYPDGVSTQESVFQVLPRVLERMNYCFSNIHKNYYYNAGESIFNHLNSDHYAMFLYWVSNEAYQQELVNLAEKAFLLNKALHGVDAFYSIKLPAIFFICSSCWYNFRKCAI